ncbi:hypothetical protein [Thermococcus sp.]
MPRPPKIDYTKLKFKPMELELKLRIGAEGRLVIPGPIRDMYGLDEGKVVHLKIVGVAEVTEDAIKKKSSKRRRRK